MSADTGRRVEAEHEGWLPNLDVDRFVASGGRVAQRRVFKHELPTSSSMQFVVVKVIPEQQANTAVPSPVRWSRRVAELPVSLELIDTAIDLGAHVYKAQRSVQASASTVEVIAPQEAQDLEEPSLDDALRLLFDFRQAHFFDDDIAEMFALEIERLVEALGIEAWTAIVGFALRHAQKETVAAEAIRVAGSHRSMRRMAEVRETVVSLLRSARPSIRSAAVSIAANSRDRRFAEILAAAMDSEKVPGLREDMRRACALLQDGPR